MTDPSDPVEAGSPGQGSGSTPEPTTLPTDLEPAPKTRTGYIVVAGILVAVIAVAVIATYVGRRSSSYAADDKQSFMAACTAGGGDAVKDVCGCIYDQLSQKVPYERYVAIDAELKTQRSSTPDAPLRFPPEVESVRSRCVELTKPTVQEPTGGTFDSERPTVKGSGGGR